jgi:hypothetical protein
MQSNPALGSQDDPRAGLVGQGLAQHRLVRGIMHLPKPVMSLVWTSKRASCAANVGEMHNDGASRALCATAKRVSECQIVAVVAPGPQDRHFLA